MKRPAYIACFLFGAVSSLAVAASTQPASRPADATTAWERVNSALALSRKDELLLSSMRDGTDPAEQNGFYRMMRIVADLPALSAEELRRLDSPAWANLLREPGRYRGKPVRLALRVYVVRELVAGKGLRANPYWPEGRSIYEVHATLEGSADEPVILYAPAPPANLGPPGETLPDGRMRYKSGPAYQAAGVYLQYYNDASTDGAKREYPVVLAWQFDPAGAGGSFLGLFTEKEQLYTWGAALLVLIAAVGMFVFVQRRLRRPSAARRGPVFKNYKPLRDEYPEEKSDAEFVKQYVDPDLAAAVEDYEQEHPHATNANEETP